MDQKQRQNTILSLILRKQQELSNQDIYATTGLGRNADGARRWAINKAREGWVGTDGLAVFDVTMRTFQRDLDALNRRGLLERGVSVGCFNILAMEPDEPGRRDYVRLTDAGVAAAKCLDAVQQGA